jgi:hypothetical protein
LIAFIGKQHNKTLENIFKKTYKDLEFELAGSYRRKNKDRAAARMD